MTLFNQSYGEGYPLIILHGLLGASGNWHTLSRNVFSQRFAVHALDLRNHGRSPHHPSMTYGEMAGDVVAFMDAQGLETAHVLGHSMGGKVAMTLALSHPDRLGRLVVADIARGVGGGIALTTAPGKGTTFYIAWPLDQGA